jgi:hypothetical protein
MCWLGVAHVDTGSRTRDPQIGQPNGRVGVGGQISGSAALLQLSNLKARHGSEDACLSSLRVHDGGREYICERAPRHRSDTP